MTMEETKCGERRCTVEEAELELKGYRDRYSVDYDKSKLTTIDALDPSQTRIKTEIDEAGELIDKAKKSGKQAWAEFEEGVSNALEALRGGFHNRPEEKQ